jgi:hypothetical protein
MEQTVLLAMPQPQEEIVHVLIAFQRMDIMPLPLDAFIVPT